MPKPRRRPRVRCNIRPSKRVECRAHLQWIRGFPCSAPTTGLIRHTDGRVACSGRIEAHHQKTRGAGGGDEQAVPLCQVHHAQLDSPGWSQRRFEEAYKINFAGIAADLWQQDALHRIRWERKMEKANG